jgi:hypothetical protein
MAGSNQCEAIGRTGKRCRHPRYNADTQLCAYHFGLRGPALREYAQHVKMVRLLGRVLKRQDFPPAESAETVLAAAFRDAVSGK